GKSLIDVERDLHIRAHLIHAIEKADINGFEFKWVIPGYVRAYAKYLGMDPEIGYRRFCEEAGVSNITGNPNINGSGKNAAQSRKTRR
ncbi:MAG: helix-turn-helix transcriptional regulator, partial [Rhodobacteraceae bacterium]|nr:helix-turn-helix transcriptional regulator [Paracoccaceae bacterium]